ncbi:polysaccharide deacetylase family protein [Pedobacter sp.]|uniref:polysaccharide deacetylase family protein n=1 Tax=Pedobacter sp. TaxID=1411316 RepID=UPI00396C9683
MFLLIFCKQLTPRVKYIFNFIFKDILLYEEDLSFTSNEIEFLQYDGPKFSYAEQPLKQELHFGSCKLLFETKIQPQHIDQIIFGDTQVPFPVKNGFLPFDVFAASFYFVSRYEEYLPFEPDKHLRFKAENSLLFQLDLLYIPVIDVWALMLKNILLKYFPLLKFGSRAFKFVPTFDIDRAYHFRNSGILKNTARIIKALLEKDKERLKNVLLTGLKKRKDPFDTYEMLRKIHNKHNLNPIFFFLYAHKRDKRYDVNIKPGKENFNALIKETAQYADIGIHPSYASNQHKHLLTEEIKNLSMLIEKPIHKSRQHFLRLHLPKTYLQLKEVDILHDYSMGYASQPGFRAGTCTSFYWYDLQLEKQSVLKVYPFAVMDSTLKVYLKLNPEKAKETISKIMGNVKLVNGTFCCLWHNESLSETETWKGWSEVYRFMVEMAVK